MSITMKLQGLHAKGVGLAQEAMSRAGSAPARPRRAASLGLAMEAVTKAGLPATLVQPKPQPQKRRK